LLDNDQNPSSELAARPDELLEIAPDLIEGFFGLTIAQLAIAKTGFDIYEEMERLTEIMRDPDPRVSLAGLRHFRKVVKEVGEAAGRLVTTKHSIAHVEKDGTRVTQEIESAAQLTERLERRPDHSFPVREQFPQGNDERADEIRRSGLRADKRRDPGAAESVGRNGHGGASVGEPSDGGALGSS